MTDKEVEEEAALIEALLLSMVASGDLIVIPQGNGEVKYDLSPEKRKEMEGIEQ